MSENLISLADRTKDEQRAIARAGGIASGEARRKRKQMREEMQILLDEEITTASGNKVTKRRNFLARVYHDAMEGNAKAQKLIVDISGEAPTKQEITGEDGAPLLVTFAEIDARFKAVNEHKDD